MHRADPASGRIGEGPRARQNLNLDPTHGAGRGGVVLDRPSADQLTHRQIAAEPVGIIAAIPVRPSASSSSRYGGRPRPSPRIAALFEALQDDRHGEAAAPWRVDQLGPWGRTLCRVPIASPRVGAMQTAPRPILKPAKHASIAGATALVGEGAPPPRALEQAGSMQRSKGPHSPAGGLTCRPTPKVMPPIFAARIRRS
jgi:hypothetical protein